MHSSSTHERTGTGEFHEIDAQELRPGQRLLLPDGQDSAEVVEVDTVLDDYGHPALYFVVLDTHMNIRVAHGTRVQASRGKAGRPADLLFSGPATPAVAGSPDAAAGSPDAEAASAEHEAGPTDDGGSEPAAAEVTVSAASVSDAPADIPAPVPLRGPSEITLDTGDVVLVPGAAPARTSTASPSALARIPRLDGKPEDLMRDLEAAHPGRAAVHELTERLSKGINIKSGACLKDLRDLAYELYVGQRDAEGALKVADLLAVVPHDGNPARWSSVESALGLASHLAREAGEEERAEAYGELLRAPEEGETDPFRARMAERVRQRTLNEPNLYDKEIARAGEKKDHSEERGWRLLRLGTLLHLRAHGGSEAFEQDELDRRIAVELEAVRG